jgi:hypothetical protein
MQDWTQKLNPMGGIPTLQNRQQNILNEAQFGGTFRGQPTLQSTQWDQDFGLRKDAQDWLQIFQDASMTGFDSRTGNPTMAREGQTFNQDFMNRQQDHTEHAFNNLSANQSASLAEQAKNRAISQGHLNLAQDKFKYSKEEATRLAEQAAQEGSQSGLSPEYSGQLYNLINEVATGGLSFEEARDQINMLKDSGLYSPDVAAYMTQTLLKYMPKNPTPTRSGGGLQPILDNTQLGNNLDSLGIDANEAVNKAKNKAITTIFDTLVPTKNPNSPANWVKNASQYMPWNN